MDTAILAIIILCVIYVPIWVWVWRNPEKAERYHLVKYGPALMIKTHLGIKTMDRLGKHRLFWRVFGFLSRLISAGLFFMMMYMLIVALLALPSRIGSGGIGIQYALAIPGLNPMLPLTYGILALFIAMVVHEMGHGIQSRANDCNVDSTGLLYGVVPLGAFCEPNEEELPKLSRRAQMDVYSAGISVNTFVAVISIVLMLFICSGITPAVYGEGETDEVPGVYSLDDLSPAYLAGIPTSALIVGIKEVDEDSYHAVSADVNGSLVAIQSDLELSPLKFYNLRYLTEDGNYHESEGIQMGALIKTVTNNSPASQAELLPLCYLYSIEITRDGSLLDTYMISSAMDFKELMLTTLPGDVAVVTTATIADGGVIETFEHEATTLTASGSVGYLGLAVTDSGMSLTTPEIRMSFATNPFQGCTTPFSYVQAFFSYLSGPLNGLDPIPNAITWWYDAPAGDTTWVIVKILYWIFWLDILLAISNALPAYPFDGGFLFEGAINWLLELLGIKDEERRRKLSDSISGSVSNVVLVMFGLVLLAFII